MIKIYCKEWRKCEKVERRKVEKTFTEVNVRWREIYYSVCGVGGSFILEDMKWMEKQVKSFIVESVRGGGGGGEEEGEGGGGGRRLGFIEEKKHPYLTIRSPKTQNFDSHPMVNPTF